MIVAVCSLSGAPGVTTLAMAVAASWPATPLTVPVLVEADVSGGDIAAWHGLAPDRGIVSLAAASRSTTHSRSVMGAQAWVEAGVENAHASSALLRHTVEVPGGLHVVMAPADPLETGRAVGMLAGNPELLAGRATVIDAGRAQPGSAGATLLSRVDVVIVMVDPSDPGHAHRLKVCAPVLASLRDDGVRVGLAVAGACPHTDNEISQISSALPVWARVPDDPSGAALVRGQHCPPTRLRDRWAAWWASHRDPDSLEWMPLIRCARGLAELCDDFAGVGIASTTPVTMEVTAV